MKISWHNKTHRRKFHRALYNILHRLLTSSGGNNQPFFFFLKQQKHHSQKGIYNSIHTYICANSRALSFRIVLKEKKIDQAQHRGPNKTNEERKERTNHQLTNPPLEIHSSKMFPCSWRRLASDGHIARDLVVFLASRSSLQLNFFIPWLFLPCLSRSSSQQFTMYPYLFLIAKRIPFIPHHFPIFFLHDFQGKVSYKVRGIA